MNTTATFARVVFYYTCELLWWHAAAFLQDLISDVIAHLPTFLKLWGCLDSVTPELCICIFGLKHNFWHFFVSLGHDPVMFDMWIVTLTGRRENCWWCLRCGLCHQIYSVLSLSKAEKKEGKKWAGFNVQWFMGKQKWKDTVLRVDM